MKYRLLYAFALCWGFSCVAAQPLYKSHQPISAWTQGRAEAYQHHGSFFYGQLGAGIGGPAKLGEGPWSGWQAKIGYERWLSKGWQAGIFYHSERFPSNRLRQGQAYLQHNGRIGKSLIFLQEIGWSRLEYTASSNWQWHIGGYVGRRFPMGGRHWQLGLRGYAYRLLDPPGDPRRFSKTALSLHADFALGRQVSLGAFVSKNALYFFGLAQERYDKDGNLIESIPYHRLNQIQPAAGILLRWVWGIEKMKAEAPFNLWNAQD